MVIDFARNVAATIHSTVIFEPSTGPHDPQPEAHMRETAAIEWPLLAFLQQDVAHEIAADAASPTILPQVHKTTLNKAM